MTHVYINALGVTCALGVEVKEVCKNMFSNEPKPLTLTDKYSLGRPLHLGCVNDPLPPFSDCIGARWMTRSNQLIQQALKPITPAVEEMVEIYGAHRIAVVIGCSTAGGSEGELAARQHRTNGSWPKNYDYAQQEMVNSAEFIAQTIGLFGPCHVISTACSSSAKAMASAARLLRSGLADAVITGGVDALCSLTVAGFTALESISSTTSQPMSANRSGINLGEGAGLFLMSRSEGDIRLAGWGESSDAHHMSAPDPTGSGAQDAMRQALKRGGVSPRNVDYINMHGTGTLQNDAMESRAIADVFGLETPVSSTKPLTGHALAAAGCIEAILSCQMLMNNPAGLLLPHWWDGLIDPDIPQLNLVKPNQTIGRPVLMVLSNSFAFGGSNATLLLARE